MEKIEYRGTWVRGDFYNATDVDALLADVRRLVEAVKEYAGLAGGVHEIGCPEDDTCSCHVMVRFEKAVAAVERHLATNIPHSAPPPADNGRA